MHYRSWSCHAESVNLRSNEMLSLIQPFCFWDYLRKLFHTLIWCNFHTSKVHNFPAINTNTLKFYQMITNESTKMMVHTYVVIGYLRSTCFNAFNYKYNVLFINNITILNGSHSKYSYVVCYLFSYFLLQSLILF